MISITQKHLIIAPSAFWGWALANRINVNDVEDYQPWLDCWVAGCNYRSNQVNKIISTGIDHIREAMFTTTQCERRSDK